MSKTCHQCHRGLAADHVGPKYCSAECAERRRAGNRIRLAKWKAKHPRGAAAHSRAWRKRHAAELRKIERARRNANRDKVRAIAKRSYWANVDKRRTEQRKRGRARYATDPVHARERSALWRALNQDKVKAQSLRWRLANLDRRARTESNRRALMKRADGSYSLAEWRAKCAECGGVCFYCGAARKLTADHVIPLTRGGSNRIDNIVPACSSCNSSKNNTNPARWLERRRAAGRPVTSAALAMLERLRAS